MLHRHKGKQKQEGLTCVCPKQNCLHNAGIKFKMSSHKISHMVLLLIDKNMFTFMEKHIIAYHRKSLCPIPFCRVKKFFDCINTPISHKCLNITFVSEYSF